MKPYSLRSTKTLIMVKTILSYPSSFLASPLSPLPHHARLVLPLYRPLRLDSTVKLSFHEIPPPDGLDSFVGLPGIVSRVEGLLYMLADAAVAASPSSTGADASTTARKNGGWFGFISDAIEVVLKVESSLAMQNLQLKIKAIQERFARNQEEALEEAYSSSGKQIPDYTGPRKVALTLVRHVYASPMPGCWTRTRGLGFAAVQA